MKLILVLVGAACLAAGATGAIASPPIINEPWTPLPCPQHPVSTVDIEGCLERDVVRSDRLINAKAATIFNLIGRASDRSSFVAGERAWLQYRRRSCTAAASVYRGGSAEPVAFLQCEKTRNAKHLSDLVDTERMLRHG
jgi:uncharacterized protein YecT (DUF1311 family)